MLLLDITVKRRRRRGGKGERGGRGRVRRRRRKWWWPSPSSQHPLEWCPARHSCLLLMNSRIYKYFKTLFSNIWVKAGEVHYANPYTEQHCSFFTPSLCCKGWPLSISLWLIYFCSTIWRASFESESPSGS